MPNLINMMHSGNVYSPIKVPDIPPSGSRGHPMKAASLSRKTALLSQAVCLLALIGAGVGLGAVFAPSARNPLLQMFCVCAILLIPAGIYLHLLVEKQVLAPLRRLATLTENPFQGGSELEALSAHVRALVDDMQRSRAELAERDEALRQAEKLALIGKLAAGVAHSVRNPLTSVKLRLFSLTRSLTLSAEQQEDFDVIAGQIRHIDVIVRNFLEFSRRPPLRKVEADLEELARQCFDLLSHRLTDQGVEVELRNEAGVPRVKADPDQIKEALVNLILNACEAMKGKGTLRCRLEAGIVPPWGHCVVLRLHDSGSGVPDELRETIFQPFFSNKTEGTGLGLPIARRIFEEHGGWLSLAPDQASGACFVAGLPAGGKSVWIRY